MVARHTYSFTYLSYFRSNRVCISGESKDKFIKDVEALLYDLKYISILSVYLDLKIQGMTHFLDWFKAKNISSFFSFSMYSIYPLCKRMLCISLSIVLQIMNENQLKSCSTRSSFFSPLLLKSVCVKNTKFTNLLFFLDHAQLHYFEQNSYVIRCICNPRIYLYLNIFIKKQIFK